MRAVARQRLAAIAHQIGPCGELRFFLVWNPDWPVVVLTSLFMPFFSRHDDPMLQTVGSNQDRKAGLADSELARQPRYNHFYPRLNNCEMAHTLSERSSRLRSSPEDTDAAEPMG